MHVEESIIWVMVLKFNLLEPFSILRLTRANKICYVANLRCKRFVLKTSFIK